MKLHPLLLAATVLASLLARADETPATLPTGPLPGGNPARVLAPGPFAPTWQSLVAQHQPADWFRDAKFGIWAHWTAQCVPEQGDWYARNMYLEGHAQYQHHLKTYGHPADTGFMEIDNLWKAERWDPEKLMDLYVRAGARYFVALANHHDNFDAYDSKYHAWNSVRVGPKRDIVGEWACAARARGLRFGVSNHSAHAWHWLQAAYAYDAEGPRAGQRYDAFKLRKEDGVGKWWEGLDPQDLYTGPNMVMPDGITSVKDRMAWHQANDRKWNENPPAQNPKFTDTWFLRAQDLVDKYRPDLVYFDNTGLPLGQAGLDFAAHYYNASRAWHGGRAEAVLNAKKLSPEQARGLVADIERGVATSILEQPWQTDTCIGSWHYNRSLYDKHGYKTVAQVARMLCDIVSKNGNLLLSVPLRGDGTLDDQEIAFLEGLAKWMPAHADAIFGTRPWVIYGEGPSTEENHEPGQYGGARDVRTKPYTSADIRFTTKAGALYAIALEQPAAGAARALTIKTLATNSPHVSGRAVTGVTLVGGDALKFTQDATGLHIELPATLPAEHTVAVKISGVLP